jgi:hypothetical protein
MTKLEKIEQDISTLPPADVHKLADWLAQYQAELWDRQIAADVEAGKFEGLPKQALADHRSGLTRPI